MKWENVEITIGIIFFVWDLYSLFFLQESLKSQLKKINPHLKCQFPHKIVIWPKSLLSKPFEKWLNPRPLPPSPRGEGGCKLCMMQDLGVGNTKTKYQQFYILSFFVYYIYCFYSTFNCSVLCFWSYLGRYSFYTFYLMYSLKKS